MIPPDYTKVSEESPREALGNIVMQLRGAADLRRYGMLQVETPPTVGDLLAWASRLERAVQQLDSEKRGAVPPAEQDTPQ